MYPTLPSSILLHPAHFNLHQPLCYTLNVIRTKISHEIGQFPQILGEKLKLFILTENWHIWYVRGAESESRRRLWNSDPKIHFGANLRRKSQSFLFCLKIGINDTLMMLITRTNKQELLTGDHQGCSPFSKCESLYCKIRSLYTR